MYVYFLVVMQYIATFKTIACINTWFKFQQLIFDLILNKLFIYSFIHSFILSFKLKDV